MADHSLATTHDLVALWKAHCRYEFEARDLDATMASMLNEPYVNHADEQDPVRRYADAKLDRRRRLAAMTLGLELGQRPCWATIRSQLPSPSDLGVEAPNGPTTASGVVPPGHG